MNAVRRQYGCFAGTEGVGESQDMLKTRDKRRSTTFGKWLLSYIGILIIPFVFGCGIYEYALTQIKEDVDYVQYQTLTQVKDAVENTLDLCDNIGVALSRSAEAEALKRFDQEGRYSTRQLLYAKALLEDMFLYAGPNEMISEVILYFPKTDHILKNGRFCPLAYSVVNEQNDYKMTVEEIRALAGKKSGLHALGTGTGGLLYTFCSQAFRGNPPDVMVLVYLNTTALRNIVSLSNSSLFLIMEDGSGFSSSGQEFHPEWGGVLGEEEEFSLISNKKEYIMAIRSGEYDLDLVNIIPKRLYLGKLERMKQILAVYAAVSLGLGLGGAWYVSKRNYRPVKELLELTDKMADGRTEDPGNDFSRIRSAYQSLLSAYEDNAKRLKESRVSEKNNWMNELLKGRSRSVSLARTEPAPWMNGMPYDAFALISVDIVDMGSMSEGEASEVSTEVMDMAYFIIRNVLHELLCESFHAVEAETDGKLFALVNLKEDELPDPVTAQLKKTGEDMASFIREHYHMKLMVNISGIHTGRKQISRCYEDIQEMLEYRDFRRIPEEAVLCMADCGLLSAHGREEEGMFRRLRECLASEDFERASGLIDQMKRKRQSHADNGGERAGADPEREVQRGRRTDGNAAPEPGQREGIAAEAKPDGGRAAKRPKTSRPATSERLKKAERPVITTGPETGARSGNADHPKAVKRPERPEPSGSESFSEGAEAAEPAEYGKAGIRAEPASHIKERKREGAPEEALAGKQGEREVDLLIDRIADYIEEHFTDPMLSAGVLADEFGIGLSYMSRSFKRRKGVGILDFTNRLRLNEAKKLIAGGVTIKDAAGQVGYFTTQPLIRVFRQMEGMTPSEYRNSLGK